MHKLHLEFPGSIHVKSADDSDSAPVLLMAMFTGINTGAYATAITLVTESYTSPLVTENLR